MKYMGTLFLGVTLMCQWEFLGRLRLLLHLDLYQRDGLFLVGDLVGLWQMILMASSANPGSSLSSLITPIYCSLKISHLFMLHSAVEQPHLCIAIKCRIWKENWKWYLIFIFLIWFSCSSQTKTYIFLVCLPRLWKPLWVLSIFVLTRQPSFRFAIQHAFSWWIYTYDFQYKHPRIFPGRPSTLVNHVVCLSGGCSSNHWENNRWFLLKNYWLTPKNCGHMFWWTCRYPLHYLPTQARRSHVGNGKGRIYEIYIMSCFKSQYGVEEIFNYSTIAGESKCVSTRRHWGWYGFLCEAV